MKTKQSRFRWASILVPLFSLLTLFRLPAAAPWSGPIMQPGIAAMTCAAQKKDASGAALPPNLSFPFGVADLRSPLLSKYTVQGTTAALWNPPMYHHPDWSAQRMGCVFGITVDAAGNMYVAAHSLFVPYWGPPSFGNPYLQFGTLSGSIPTNSSGTIFRLDATTGAATVFAVLPQKPDPNLPWNPAAGPGIGNLTYDAVNDQFFATNLEDGRIYRITKSGLVGLIASVFDPLVPDNGLAGMPPLGDRLWAIEASGNQLYYSVWNQGTAANPQVIRRVTISAGGALNTSTDTAVLTVTPTPSAAAGYLSTPVSDIALSQDGLTMTLAERGMLRTTAAGGSYLDYYVVANHYTPVKIAQYTGTSWSITKTLATGKNSPQGEGYGGADFGPESGQSEVLVWMSSADLAGSPGPHGLQGVRQTLFPATLAQSTLAYAVPYDPGYTASGPDVKGIGADVEIMQEKSCVRFTSGRVECLGANSFSYSFCFTNNWTNTVYHLAVLDLPTGTSFSPGPILDFPAGIAPGQGLCTNVTVTTSSSAGVSRSLCFRLAFHTRDFADCCLVSECIKLPECCLPPVGETKVDCDPATGVMTYSFSFQNNSGQTLGALYLLQANPPCFALTPSSFNFVPPLPNGGVTNVTLTLVKTNLCGDELCLKLLALNTNSTECCVMDHCVELPKCGHPGDISSDLKTVVVSYPPGTKVAEVRFLLDDVVFGRTTLPPYEAAFPPGIPIGLHAVVVQTLYGSGARTESDPRYIYFETDRPGGASGKPTLSVASLSGGIQLTVQATPNLTCYLEASDSIDPLNWRVVQTMVGDGTPHVLQIDNPNGTVLFFRIREE